MKKFLRVALAAGAMAATVPAFSQTITHWLDRQIHGSARHITPRHHKPGEPLYPGEKVTYIDGRPMIITRRRLIDVRPRHHYSQYSYHEW